MWQKIIPVVVVAAERRRMLQRCVLLTRKISFIFWKKNQSWKQRLTSLSSSSSDNFGLPYWNPFWTTRKLSKSHRFQTNHDTTTQPPFRNKHIDKTYQEQEMELAKRLEATAELGRSELEPDSTLRSSGLEEPHHNMPPRHQLHTKKWWDST